MRAAAAEAAKALADAHHADALDRKLESLSDVSRGGETSARLEIAALEAEAAQLSASVADEREHYEHVTTRRARRHMPAVQGAIRRSLGGDHRGVRADARPLHGTRSEIKRGSSRSAKNARPTRPSSRSLRTWKPRGGASVRFRRESADARGGCAECRGCAAQTRQELRVADPGSAASLPVPSPRSSLSSPNCKRKRQRATKYPLASARPSAN